MKIPSLLLTSVLLSLAFSSCNVDCSETSKLNTLNLNVDGETSIVVPTAEELYSKELNFTYDVSTSTLSGYLYIIYRNQDAEIFNVSFPSGNFKNTRNLRFVEASELSYDETKEEIGIPREFIQKNDFIQFYVILNYPYKYEIPIQKAFYETCDYIFPYTLNALSNVLYIRFSEAPIDTTGNPGNPVIKGATGVLELAPAAPEVGDDLSIRLTDADLNINDAIVENYTVEASSDKSEIETVLLTETGVNTGIFEGIVSTTSGTSAGTNNDGVFNAENNTEITVSYDDVLDADGNNPAPITKSVRLTQAPPSLSFADFLNKSVILDSTVTYNGTSINPANIASVTKALSLYLPDATSGCTAIPAPLPGQCYGFEYEFINGTTNKFDVYYNTDFNYCNCATDATPSFSSEFTYSGNTVRINNGIMFEDWTLTIVDNNHFRLHILSGGGTQVSERHYSVKR